MGKRTRWEPGERQQVKALPHKAPGRAPVGMVHLIGPLRIRTRDGFDCTPGGSVRKALFALLILSDRGTRSRAALQELLWAGRDPRRAAGSLRSALSSLRRELAPLGEDILETDTDTVTLNRARLGVDIDQYRSGALPMPDPDRAPDLLEGLDVGSEAREDFEDWLRLERSAWADLLDSPPDLSARAAAPAAPSGERQSPGLGLLSVVGDGLAPGLVPLCDEVLDFIAAETRVLCGSDIYDHRDGLSQRFTVGDAPGPAYLLQLHVRPLDSGAHLTLKVIETASRRALWNHRVACPDPGMLNMHHPVMAEFMSETIEHLATTILPGTEPGRGALYAPYQSLNMMFSLAPDAQVRAGTLLQSAWSETGDPVHLGLLSYLDTFKVGESWGRAVGNHPETADMAREGLSAGAFNGLYLTTAGYALFYLTDNTELAADMLMRAVEVAPAQAMAWDHLALFWHAQGRRDKARAAADRAVALGRFSPLRFAYDTTLSMVAHAEGDYESAIRFGRRALDRRPEYSSALRYVTAGLGLTGRVAEAEQMAQRILRLDPTFSAHRRTQGLLKLTDEQAGEALREGLLLAGLH